MNSRTVIRQGLLMSLLLSVMLGCGSRLPRERLLRHPVGGGSGDATAEVGLARALDLKSITMTEIDRGEDVSLDSYMEARNLRWLMLVFGSQNCAACMREAREIRDRLAGKHELFLDGNKQGFELSVVNIDPKPSAAIKAWRDSGKVAMPFIRLADPRAMKLQRYFLPSGAALGVPFQALILRDKTRQGIVWYYQNDKIPTLETLLGRIEKTMGVNSVDPVPTVTPTPEPTTGPVVTSPEGLFAEGSDRLEYSAALTPEGQSVTVGSLVGGASLKFVQVARGACSGTCVDNRRQLAAVCGDVRTAGPHSCRVVTLAETSSIAGTDGLSQPVYQGGADFFDVFKTHFNWNWQNEPATDPETWAYIMPTVEGPLTLGFNADGLLVFSAEGALAEGSIQAVVNSDSLTMPAEGPNFPFMNSTLGAFGFATTRRQAKYTVIHTFATSCDSCRAELQHFSAEGGLLDRCQARAGLCQMAAVESGEPEDGQAASLPSYLTSVESWASGLNIRVPMWIDTRLTAGDWTKDWVRFLKGYVVALAGGESGYRTVVYDREGKVLASFLLDETGGAQMETFVDELLSREAQGGQ